MMTIKDALLSLEGLSVGDAFGECFYAYPAEMIARRELPPGPWRWTDDTQMALSIVAVLREHGRIDQDALMADFARRYQKSPWRGYGAGAARLLRRVGRGADWREEAPALFDGGSFGNGGAMRAAPIGGFYAGDPKRAAGQALLSAQVTHAHPEGQAGAVAIAAAGAIAAAEGRPDGEAFIRETLAYIPGGLTRSGVELALEIPPGDFGTAVQRLGTGAQISAQDTVPFCLWCAAYNLDDYEAALWRTVSGLGDRDTTCAIVGGIVALSSRGVPEEWVRRREPLP
jgi:ADP-ribosylglycohydrolase